MLRLSLPFLRRVAPVAPSEAMYDLIKPVAHVWFCLTALPLHWMLKLFRNCPALVFARFSTITN